mmetsp:Transcript_21222/g.71358  ORF Transcript_21222/g.71358 Transcript_21222/m.71358 type:complete len:701 (+) Transcript_21222:58-2160(+)
MASDNTDWEAWAAELTSFPPLEQTVLRLNNLIFLAIFIAILVVVRGMYWLQLRALHLFRGPAYKDEAPRSLNRLLTTEDNKAVAVSFASFAFGLCVVMSGAFDSLNRLPLADAVTSALAYVALGLVLVPLSKLINASTLRTSAASATDTLVYGANLASAFLDSSSFIGSAIMLRAALLGPQREALGLEVGKILVLWVIQRVLLGLVTLVRQYSCGALGGLVDGDPGTAPKTAPVVAVQGGRSQDLATEPIVAGHPTATLAYSFANVRRQMTVAAAIEADDVHAGLVLSADILASVIVISAPVHTSFSLAALVTWAAFATAAHAVIVVALDAAVYRVARVRFAQSPAVLGAVVLEVSCVLASAILVSHQFREAFAPAGQSTEVSPGFQELGDVAFSITFTPQGIVQFLLFAAWLVLYIFLARATFSVEYVIHDFFDKRRSGTGDDDLGLEQINTPALAVSYAGYCVAHSFIFTGVTDCIAFLVTDQLVTLVLWCALGSAALVLSQLSSNLLLLRGVTNAKELRKNNMAVAIVDLGHSLAAGLIIQAATSGASDSVAAGVVSFWIFYLVSQALFVIFSLAYQALTRYNDLEAFRQNNAAAAVGHCMSQIALGYMLASPIYKTTSLPIFALQAGLSMVVLLLSRVFVDKVLLWRHALDQEIATDVNWGAAVIEGAFAIGIAVFVDALLPQTSPETCNQLIALF